jgi:DNA-binding winged helix-turn-helix (wHTH) protein/Tol biopolymer transport system component
MDDTSKNVYEFEGFRLDPARQLLMDAAGRPIELPARAFDALHYLVQRGGEVVDKVTLMRVVWPNTVVEDNSLHKCILSIRRALGDDGVGRRFVVTLPGRGFRFVAAVRELPGTRESAVQQNLPERNVGSVSGVPSADLKRRNWVVPTAVGAVAVISVMVIVGWHRQAPVISPADYVQLTDVADSATAPALSPDGRLLAFIRNGTAFLSAGQIWLKALPDGEPVQLTHESGLIFAPTFTSNGTRVAYSVAAVDRPNYLWNTWTVATIGGAPELLLPNASGLSFIGPQEVMYSEFKSGIHLGIATSLEDRAQHRDVYLPSHERGMAHYSYLSPDHQSVLIVEMGGDGSWQRCRLVPFDGRTSGTAVGPDGACLSAAWSPDGSWMYFSAQSTTGLHLWRQRYPDGSAQQLTFGPSNESMVVAAPDGKSLVAAVGLVQIELWIHNGQGERRLTSEGLVWDPWLSADAQRVYYLSKQRTGNEEFAELRRIDISTGRSSTVLPGNGVTSFDLSQNERWIVFATLTPSHTSEIWVAPADRNTPPKRVAVGGDEARFDRSQRIYFRQVNGRVNYLQRVNIDGTGLTRIAAEPILEFRGVSPDGQYAAVTRASAEGLLGEFLTPLASGKTVQISPLPRALRWSYDGKALYVEIGAVEHSYRDGRTRVVPLGSDGLPAEALDPQPANAVIINRAEDSLALASDSGTYAFVEPRSSTNIYRIALH